MKPEDINTLSKMFTEPEQSEVQDETQAEVQDETQAEVQDETQPEAQAEAQAEVQDEAQAENHPEAQAEEPEAQEDSPEVIKVNLGEEEVELPIQLITAVKDGSLEQDYRVFMKIAEAAEKDPVFKSYLESVIKGESEKFHSEIVKADFSQLGFNPPQEVILQAMRSTKEPDPVKAVKKYLNISGNTKQEPPAALQPERRSSEVIRISRKNPVKALEALMKYGDSVEFID